MLTVRSHVHIYTKVQRLSFIDLQQQPKTSVHYMIHFCLKRTVGLRNAVAARVIDKKHNRRVWQTSYNCGTSREPYVHRGVPEQDSARFSITLSTRRQRFAMDSPPEGCVQNAQWQAERMLVADPRSQGPPYNYRTR